MLQRIDLSKLNASHVEFRCRRDRSGSVQLSRVRVHNFRYLLYIEKYVFLTSLAQPQNKRRSPIPTAENGPVVLPFRRIAVPRSVNKGSLP
jgi:hypothetical protein